MTTTTEAEQPGQPPDAARRPGLRGPRPRRRAGHPGRRWRPWPSSSPSRASPASTSRPTNYAPLDSFLAYVGRLLFGTHLRRAASRWSSRCRSRSGIALFISHYAPRGAGRPGRLRHRPAGRRALGRLRPLGRADPGAAAGHRSTSGSTTTSASSRSSRARPRSPARPSLTAGVVLAIMILPIITAICREIFAADAPAPRGGRARAGRHPVGDDPLRGLPLRPLRHGLRGHARPGPRARRDDGRRDGALGQPGGHPQHDLQHQPGDHRGQHRARASPRRHRPS